MANVILSFPLLLVHGMWLLFDVGSCGYVPLLVTQPASSLKLVSSAHIRFLQALG